MVFVLVSVFDAFCEYHFAELQLNWSVNFVVMFVLIYNELGLSSLLLLIYAHICVMKLKIKLYIRPKLMYSAECSTVGKKEEQILEKIGMRMLRRIKTKTGSTIQ